MLADGFEFHVTGPPEFVVPVFLLIVLPLYFLPTIIAAARRCRTTGWVFLIDLLLGWTLIGWVVALVIAVASRRGGTLPPPPEARWRGTWQ